MCFLVFPNIFTSCQQGLKLSSSIWNDSFILSGEKIELDWNETLTYLPAEGFCFCCKQKHFTVAMEMEKGHTSIRRGVSWSPGGLRKPLQATQNMHTPGTECNASRETTGLNNEQMSRKTSKCLFIWRLPSLFGEPRQKQESVLLLCYFITQKYCGCKYISGGLFAVLP